jgi:hypothetical protein
MPRSSGRRPRKRSSKTPTASLLSMCVASHAAFSIWHSPRGGHEPARFRRRLSTSSRPPAVRARPVASFEFFAVCEAVRHSKVGA